MLRTNNRDIYLKLKDAINEFTRLESMLACLTDQTFFDSQFAYQSSQIESLTNDMRGYSNQIVYFDDQIKRKTRSLSRLHGKEHMLSLFKFMVNDQSVISTAMRTRKRDLTTVLGNLHSFQAEIAESIKQTHIKIDAVNNQIQRKQEHLQACIENINLRVVYLCSRVFDSLEISRLFPMQCYRSDQAKLLKSEIERIFVQIRQFEDEILGVTEPIIFRECNGGTGYYTYSRARKVWWDEVEKTFDFQNQFSQTRTDGEKK